MTVYTALSSVYDMNHYNYVTIIIIIIVYDNKIA